MKLKILLITSLFGLFSPVLASDPDEGMWIPMLLGELNQADMKARGLKLSAEDIYSVNHSSLKDAVVSFGGFCTGELVSAEGLIFTNHHCGFDAIQKHSSTENNLIENGFWAMSHSEELQNPGLTATFIIRMEDVTTAVLKDINPGMGEQERADAISRAILTIKADAIKGTNYNADIKAFYYGNEFYLFVSETFRDVRLVGAPPVSIGNFGGDQDNWSWPRQTGDFSIFRIYAGPDNKPADYSENNVPYKPAHFFPISLKGVKEGDYTMVYGFPGRTSEYLSSFAIEQTLNVLNPPKISLRRTALDIIEKDMAANEKVAIQYAEKEAQISNYWKKWSGESHGLIKGNALNKKQEFETRFSQWVLADEGRKTKYGSLLTNLKNVYIEMNPLAKFRDYLNECILRAEILTIANAWKDLVTASKLKGATKESLQSNIEKLKKIHEKFYQNFNPATDQKLLAVMVKRFYQEMDPKMLPAEIIEIFNTYKGDFNQFSADVFSKSIFADQNKADAFLSEYSPKSWKKIAADPAYKLIISVMDFYLKNIKDQLIVSTSQIDMLNRTFMEAQREMLSDKKFYPDANGTLRLTFGQVDDYKPRDAVQYHWFTTLDGVIEKFIPGDIDFNVPPKLIDLYNRKDFGRYAENGVMHVCFTASNHTTGGNSGSPVLDAKGNLIGTNFDRNWEGTMSDIFYDPSQVRNISVDVRYTLFIIDKFGGAGYLLNEMKIVE